MFDFSTPVNRKGTYCTQWDFVADRFGADDLLPFTISDMDMATAPCVQSALAERLQHPVWGYSRWDHDDFKSAIVDWFSLRFATGIEKDAIVYGPSVIYIIARLIHLWSAPGDEVLVHTPAYDAFEKVIQSSRRKMLRCPLIKGQDGFEINWPLFTEQVNRSHCKILLLCSPHNPTGRVWSANELKRIDDICHTAGVRVISDEIHMDTTFVQHHPWAGITKSRDWALVSSASKSFNIPALGGAYALLPDEQSRNDYLALLKSADGLSSPSVLGMIALISAYREGGGWLDSLNHYLKRNHQQLVHRLNDCFPSLKHKMPEGTYLSWIDLTPLLINMDALQHRLICHEKVAIMRGDTYGKEGSTFLRMNVGCSQQKLDDGIDRLLRALKECTPRKMNL